MTRQEILNRLRKIDECVESTARNTRDLSGDDEWADQELRQLRDEERRLKTELARR